MIKIAIKGWALSNLFCFFKIRFQTPRAVVGGVF
jgi:hypothetical protein